MNKYFSMTNINTKEIITYTIYPEYIEAITSDGTIHKLKKNGKCDNQIIMNLINNLIEQDYIINEFNII